MIVSSIFQSHECVLVCNLLDFTPDGTQVQNKPVAGKHLTHLYRMEFPTVINWTSPFLS